MSKKCNVLFILTSCYLLRVEKSFAATTDFPRLSAKHQLSPPHQGQTKDVQNLTEAQDSALDLVCELWNINEETSKKECRERVLLMLSIPLTATAKPATETAPTSHPTTTQPTKFTPINTPMRQNSASGQSSIPKGINRSTSSPKLAKRHKVISTVPIRSGH